MWIVERLQNTPTRPNEAIGESATATPTLTVGKPGATVCDLGSLADRLRSLRDPRHRRGIRYSLYADLVLLILARLGGEDRPSGLADWVKGSRMDCVIGALSPFARMPHA